MKHFLFILSLLFVTTISAQKTDYNTKKGYVASGYDVVEYFNQNAVKGEKKFKTTYDGVKFKFSSEKNLNLFIKNPEKYIPQYGGYCAYAIGVKGEKVSVNPKTFEIRDGKLYLFYNSWGTNTLEMWQNEGAENLQKQADQKWKEIKNK